MPHAEARGEMATGDRGVARRAKTGGFGAVPLGFATDTPRRSARSFTGHHGGKNEVNGKTERISGLYI